MMTRTIEKLREMAEADSKGLGLVYEMLRNDAEVAKALLDVAEAAQKVPEEWAKSVEFSDWPEAQEIVAELRAALDRLQELSDD